MPDQFKLIDIALQLLTFLPPGFTIKQYEDNHDHLQITRSDGMYLSLRLETYPKPRLQVGVGSPHQLTFHRDRPKSIAVNPDRRAADIWKDIQRRLWSAACDYWDEEVRLYEQQQRDRRRRTAIAQQLARIGDGKIQRPQEPWSSEIYGNHWRVTYLSIPDDTDELQRVKVTMTLDVPLPMAVRMLAVLKISQTTPPLAP